MSTVCTATTVEEIAKCYPVMAQLRPHVTRDEFPKRVTAQFREGYRLVYITDGDKPVGVAGYRFGNNLSNGHYLYVDDLVTDHANRSKGFGKTMLRWLVEEARKNRCVYLELDSGIQRTNAHRFYEREGMKRSNYHYKFRV